MSDLVSIDSSVLIEVFEKIEVLRSELEKLEAIVEKACGQWIVAAAEEPAILIPEKTRGEVFNQLLFCGADTGPPELPEVCYHACKHLEKGTVRAARAFQCGFWAKASIDCHVPHNQEAPFPGVIPAQWLILRGDHPLIPCRVYSQVEADKILGDSKDKIVESFESPAEVNLFCLGASIDVPKLVQWRRL